MNVRQRPPKCGYLWPSSQIENWIWDRIFILGLEGAFKTVEYVLTLQISPDARCIMLAFLARHGRTK